MEHYKTTEHGENVRIQWVYDEDYQTVGSYGMDTPEETKAAEDAELRQLNAGNWVALGATVEKRLDADSPWEEKDSLWGIVVGPSEKKLREFAEGSLDLDAPRVPDWNPAGVPNLSVHRFRDDVALYIPGMETTAYLSPVMARKLGAALIDFAEDVYWSEFIKSTLGTREVQA